MLRAGVRTALGRVFGGPPFDLHGESGDPGLFGPGSASWRIIAEPAAIVGGVRSLLLQLTHPLAMAGVAEHSAFRTDGLGRLQRTSGYVTTLTFGTTPEALTVTRAVRSAHATVRGHARDGRPYAADDPHLLAWVSIAMTSSMLATDAAFAPEPADAGMRDRFVAEQARGAALLDPRLDLARLGADADRLVALQRGELPLPMIDDGSLPTTVADLEAALDWYRRELAVDDHGREALRFLLWPPLPAATRAGYLPILAGALSTLPRDVRALLGVPRGRLSAASARTGTRVALAVLRAASGPSPAVAAATARAERR
ncbi:MAG: DUF2236 domain-containing protein [Actinobacteria bacterium]|nr:DUF2236 domain-containing protein [Actinomycetota bacterium]